MNSLKKGIVFVSSAIQHPRHQKRIAALSESFDVFVIYSTREQYKENIRSFQHPPEKTLNFGQMENRKYHLRIVYFFRLLLALIKRKERVVYCTSLETSVAACLAFKRPILELGDIHQLRKFPRFYRNFDRVFVRFIRLLVLTSPFFVDDYYAKIDSRISEKCVIVENKLQKSMQDTVIQFREKKQTQNCGLGHPIRLGLIGAIRFDEELKVIKSLLDSRDDLELHIYGAGNTKIFENTKNCTYHGTFQNPDDLVKIYESIDINLILYDPTNPAVFPALPNKLYESIAFGAPILCSDNTRLSQLVVSEGFGLSCNASNLSSQLDELIKNYDGVVAQLLSQSTDRYLDCFEELNKRVEDVIA